MDLDNVQRFLPRLVFEIVLRYSTIVAPVVEVESPPTVEIWDGEETLTAIVRMMEAMYVTDLAYDENGLPYAANGSPAVHDLFPARHTINGTRTLFLTGWHITIYINGWANSLRPLPVLTLLRRPLGSFRLPTLDTWHSLLAVRRTIHDRFRRVGERFSAHRIRELDPELVPADPNPRRLRRRLQESGVHVRELLEDDLQPRFVRRAYERHPLGAFEHMMFTISYYFDENNPVTSEMFRHYTPDEIAHRDRNLPAAVQNARGENAIRSEVNIDASGYLDIVDQT